MKKLTRIIIGTIVISLGVGVLVFSAYLLSVITGSGKILTLFVPTVLVGIAIIATGWAIIIGVSWRDIFESVITG